MNKQGIYKIISPSNKVYIGQSTNIEKRWRTYELLNCKQQVKLYNSLNKYGVEHHKFEIIENCEIEELNSRERYWQDFYNVLGENGLNLTLVDSEELHKKLSEESLIKMRKTFEDRGVVKGKNNPMYGKKGILNSKSKKVINVVTLKIYNSLSECCIINNLNPKYMSRELSGSRKNKTDFLYFKDDGNYFSEIKYKPILPIKIKKTAEEIHYNRSSVKLGSRNPMYGRKGKDNPKSKKVIDVELNIIYDSLQECCEINNLNPKYMSRWLTGARPNKTKYKYL